MFGRCPSVEQASHASGQHPFNEPRCGNVTRLHPLLNFDFHVAAVSAINKQIFINLISFFIEAELL